MNRLTVVTGADARFFRTLWQCLENARRHRLRLVVYDLGLGPGQRDLLQKRYGEMDWRSFDYSGLPAFVAECRPERPGETVRGRYAWKPALIRDVLRSDGPLVFWMDCATLLHAGLEPVLRALLADGTYVPYAGTSTLAATTHPATLRRLGLPPELGHRRQRAAGFCGFNRDYPGVLSLVESWCHWALQEEVIAPAGACRNTHNYDQSLLTALLNQTGLRLTEDECNISSARPLTFASVRNKVPNWLPWCLDPLARLWFAAYSGVDQRLHQWRQARARSRRHSTSFKPGR